MKERIIVVVVTLCQIMYLKEEEKENMNQFFNPNQTRQRKK